MGIRIDPCDPEYNHRVVHFLSEWTIIRLTLFPIKKKTQKQNQQILLQITSALTDHFYIPH